MVCKYFNKYSNIYLDYFKVFNSKGLKSRLFEMAYNSLPFRKVHIHMKINLNLNHKILNFIIIQDKNNY